MSKSPELTSRERVLLALRREPGDRIPRADSFWQETLAAWREEGLPADATPHDYFPLDIRGGGWVTHQADPNRMDVLEESEQWQVRRDGNGAILRYWKGRSGTPEHLGYSVETPDDWSALKETLLSVPVAARIKLKAAREAMAKAKQNDLFFCWTGVEAFEIAKDVVGHEGLCVAMADDPDWAEEILRVETDVALAGLDYLEQEGITFDGAWMYGDIAYNHGPFISPAMYRRLVLPQHRRHIAWFKDRGLPVIFHTDGDFRPLIPGLLEAGVDCFQPLEAKAKIDVRELKPAYGDQVAFMGNIDAMVLLSNDPEKIEQEVASKVPLAMRGGGYIYHSDHSVPPGVTLATYRFLHELLDRYGRF